jgi:hypothetical protein
VSKAADGHSHRIFVDDNGNGTSLATLVDNQITVWQEIPDKYIDITHTHEISVGALASLENSRINEWQGNAAGTEHAHDISLPVLGNAKSVFSVGENSAGDIYFGTSDGLLVKPIGDAYKILIDYRPYYEFNADLQTSMNRASDRHFEDTGDRVDFTSPDYTTQIAAAESSLVTDGDPYIFSGEVPSSAFKVSICPVDNFYNETIRLSSALGPDEELVKTIEVASESLDGTTLETLYAQDAEAIRAAIAAGEDIEPETSVTLYKIRRLFQNRAIWSIAFIGDVVYTSAQNGVVFGTHETSWTEASLPLGASSSIDIVPSGDDIWLGTSGGLLVSRSPSSGLAYGLLSYSLGQEVLSVAEVASGEILISHPDGVHKISDGGGTDTLVLERSEIQSISKDHSTSNVYCQTLSGNLYKSSDSGDSWSPIGDIPSGYSSTGRMFAAFGIIFVPVPGKLISSPDDGATWSDALGGTIRSSGWSDDLSSIYLGGDNLLLNTSDGTTFSSVTTLEGGPLPVLTIEGTVFDFGYAYSNSALFFLKSVLPATVEAQAKLSYDGWTAERGPWDPSLPYEIFVNGNRIVSTVDDIDRRGPSGYEFEIEPENGRISFEVSTSLTRAAAPGDSSIFVASTSGFEAGDAIVAVVGVSVTHLEVELVSGGSVLALSTPIVDPISSSAEIRVVSRQDADVTVQGTFLDSGLLNIGNNSHEEIEDALSIGSTGTPFALSEVSIRNLSELVIATKYALPDIDSNLKSWNAYMMRFSRTPSSEDFIENFFDISTTIANGESIFASLFSPSISAAVNSVVVGSGAFDGSIFAGTDAGLFYSQDADSLELSWVFVPDCPVGAVYSMVIIENALLVAGENGLFLSASGDVLRWTSVAESLIGGDSCRFIALRWKNDDSGQNYWWNSWDGLTNLVDEDLTNTIIVGGRQHLIYSSDNGVSWRGSEVPVLATDYTARTLLPISDGSAIASLNGNSGASNSLAVRTSSVADPWSTIEVYSGYEGRVASVAATDSGNTKLNIEFSFPSAAPIIKENSLIGLPLTAAGSSWEIASNSGNSITVHGRVAELEISTGDSVSVIPMQISSFAETRDGKIFMGTNAGILSDFGTFLSHDVKGGIINGVNKKGSVTAIDISGSIDSATAQSSLSSNTEDITVLNTTLDRIVATNELIGQEVFILESVNPSISILSPLPNQQFDTNSLTAIFSLLSFDLGSSGSIAVQVDSADPVIITTTTYSIVDLPNGSHTLSAWLVDSDEERLTNPEASAQVVFSSILSTSEPTVEILYPTEGLTVETPTFTAVIETTNFNSATDGSLNYSLDGAASEQLPPGTTSTREVLLSDLSDGEHSLRAFLKDANGVETEVSVSVSFVVSATTFPTIEIVSPPNNGVLASEDVLMQYAVGNFVVPDDGFVEVSLDGSPVATSQDPVFATVQGISDGEHILSVELLDLDGNSVAGGFSTSSVTITIDTAAASTPLLVISSPGDGTTYESGTRHVEIFFTASNFEIPDDGGIIVEESGLETFTQDLTSYVFPVSDEREYSVTMTLASDALTKLTNPEASDSISFSVGESVSTARALTQSISGQSSSPSTRSNGGFSAEARQIDGTGEGGWRIISNSSSSAGGATTITVGSTVQEEERGKRFKITGETSKLYVSFSQPVETQEFDEGTAYVDPTEPVNGGKTYTVKSQDKNSILLTERIDPFDTTGQNIYVGQDVYLVPSSGETTFWSTFHRSWSKDSLAGEIVRVDSSGGTSSQLVQVVSNTTRKLVIKSGVAPTEFLPDDEFVIESTVFSPLESFKYQRTSLESDHYHETDLISDLVSGSVASMVLSGSSVVDVFVTDTENFNISAVQLVPDLLDGATIVFWNPDNPAVVYEELVDSVSSDRVSVKVQNADHWNLNGASPFAISEGFSWEIDANLYGFTSGITYDNFVAIEEKLTDNVAQGEDEVAIASTAGIVVGDKVEIFDSTSSTFETTVASVETGVDLILSDEVPRSYLVQSGASLRIRRDVFADSHFHLIRNGEIDTYGSDVFRDRGYPFEHNHVLTDLIDDISSLLEDEAGEIYAAGSESSVYRTKDYGVSWQELVDAADETEGATEPDSIPSMAFGENNKLLLGTSEGYLVSQSDALVSDIIPLTCDRLEESSSVSSSSSESTSSLSSSSISSSSTSSLSSISSSSSSLSSSSSSSVSSSSKSSSSISSSSTSSISSSSSSITSTSSSSPSS